MDQSPEPPVETSIEQFAKAQTPSTLAAAHRAVLKSVMARRRTAAMGNLARVYTDAMELWDQLKANGATLEERVNGLAHVLREAWPFRREWKYLCECSDVGLLIAQCPGDATCGRTFQHGPHEFGTPCWCQKGPRFREKPRPDPKDFTAAGRSKFTKVGR